MAFPSPHAPIIPNQEFRGKSDAGAYGDFVYQTDWSIGQILEALSVSGLDKNTIVVFTSDNGPEHYAYPRVENYDHFSMGELRGLKRDIWEGGHRVPFLVRWPGIVAEGTLNETTISQVDLMSTFAEIIGFEPGAGDAEDSYSLMPLLDDSATGFYKREVSVQNTRVGSYAVRKGDWLFIDHKTGNMNWPVPGYFDSIRGYEFHDLPGELYNLRKDPSQQNNLYADLPDIVAELKDALGEVQGVGFEDPVK
jgi:arylsulfatase A